MVEITGQFHDVHAGAPHHGQETCPIRRPLASPEVVLVVIVGPLRPSQFDAGVFEIVVGVLHVGPLNGSRRHFPNALLIPHLPSNLKKMFAVHAFLVSLRRLGILWLDLFAFFDYSVAD